VPTPSLALEVQRGSIPGAPNASEFSAWFICERYVLEWKLNREIVKISFEGADETSVPLAAMGVLSIFELDVFFYFS
jgi:hypothetical protein